VPSNMAIYLRTPDTRSSGQGRRTPGPRKPPRESLGLQAVAQAGDCMAGRTTRWAVGGRGDERARRQEVCADEPRPPPPASEPPPHSTPRAHHPMPRLLLRYALPTTRSDPELLGFEGNCQLRRYFILLVGGH